MASKERVSSRIEEAFQTAPSPSQLVGDNRLNPAAIERAKEHLAYAREARERMRAATDFKAFERAWADFLTEAGRVYFKLGAGSRASGSSAGWFGLRRHKRKKDELLRYIHQARDSHEHGIELSTSQGSSMAIGGPPPPRSGRLPGGFGFMIGNMMLFGMTPRVILKPVTDTRFGTTFDPPKQHLDKPIQDPTPESIADLAIDYLDGMIADAASLVVS